LIWLHLIHGMKIRVTCASFYVVCQCSLEYSLLLGVVLCFCVWDSGCNATSSDLKRNKLHVGRHATLQFSSILYSFWNIKNRLWFCCSWIWVWNFMSYSVGRTNVWCVTESGMRRLFGPMTDKVILEWDTLQYE
jgi:hypothetical protein